MSISSEVSATDEPGETPGFAGCWDGTRRGFLRAGVLGAALWPLALPARALRAAEGNGTASDDDRYGAFRAPAHQRVLRACAARVLSAVLPEDADARREALETVLTGCGGYMARMPEPVQAEALDALDLLDFAVMRWLLGGPWSDWGDAAPADIDAFLEGLRSSRFALKRNLYQFIHDMGLVGWFAHPDAWPLLGYPGPPNLPRPEGEKPL